MDADIKEKLVETLNGPGRCACGKMDPADVTIIGEVKFGQSLSFNIDGVLQMAACKTKCNVCGHEAVRTAVSALEPEPWTGENDGDVQTS